MKVYDSYFCFVNSHLAAGSSKEELERRNSDFKEISRKLIFSSTSEGGTTFHSIFDSE